MEPVEALVRSCLAGDQQAWETLVDRYKALVHSISVRMGLTPDEASDAFQATFVEIFRGLPSLREARAITKWIIQIAMNECRRELRRRRPAFGNFDSKETESAVGTDDELQADRLIKLEREQALRESMTQLPPRCRDLIRMLFYEGEKMRYAEVAATLGLAVGSLGFIRGRCLEKLRRLLAQAGFSS
jgi:RNA polymerase sigma factor (sigma-70 family)